MQDPTILKTREVFEPQMILIPAGNFLMGSDPRVVVDAPAWELPQHEVYLPDFAIAKTPVTNFQYARFLRARRYAPPPPWRWWFWKRRWAPLGRRHYPVVNVSWHDAVAYCDWLAETTSKSYRLPSEAEWEKAARGDAGRLYPWGDDWLPDHCNLAAAEGRKAKLTPVDAYPQGASLYGVLDMLGNVWEWTRSLWGNDLRVPQFGYPYCATDGRENLRAFNHIRRVLRGVSFYNARSMARCAVRYRYSPYNCYVSVGFRVALALD